MFLHQHLEHHSIQGIIEGDVNCNGHIYEVKLSPSYRYFISALRVGKGSQGQMSSHRIMYMNDGVITKTGRIINHNPKYTHSRYKLLAGWLARKHS